MTVKEIVEKIGMHNMQLEDGKIRISFPNAWTKNNIEAIKANKAEIVQYVTVEKARIKAANDAEWEAKKAAQDAKDKPYLDAMNAKAAALRALIPAGHVFVQAEQTGDADGDPIFTFTADGMKIRRADVNIIGCASAVRDGALGAFASVYVCSIDQNKLAQIRADQQLKSAEKADKAAMRKKELAETAIPAYAMAAYKQYHGDPEKARLLQPHAGGSAGQEPGGRGRRRLSPSQRGTWNAAFSTTRAGTPPCASTVKCTVCEPAAAAP